MLKRIIKNRICFPLRFFYRNTEIRPTNAVFYTITFTYRSWYKNSGLLPLQILTLTIECKYKATTLLVLK